MATNVHLMFRDAARQFGACTAIEHANRRVSYDDLELRSNQLARWLAKRGARPGTLVAILSEDTATMVTAMLAVLKAGAAFMPLDPQLPAPRLDAMLALAEPALLLADGGMASVLARLDPVRAGRPEIVMLDASKGMADLAPAWRVDEGRWTEMSEDAFAITSEPDAFCYLYFTSGSTGQPKAIAGRLKGIDHFVRWEIETFGVAPGTRVSQLTTPSFDAYLRDVFTPLCAGGTVCVPDDRAQVLTSTGLARWIEAQGINLMHCVPTVFRLMLNDVLGPDSLPTLRWVLLAGEPVTPSDVARWTETFGDRIRLVNLYGPSETTMIKFCHRVTAEDARRGSVPIGRPMPGTRALVVDARNRACPPGTVGEILIRTPYRTLGYYKRPDLTAEVFVPNPFSDDPDDIVYRTGDFGRMLDDGSFELIGRKDHQVKVRGVRVELAEIEAHLRALPEVSDVAVVARDGGQDGPVLCAYVVSAATLSMASMRAQLATTLPDVMIPATFVPMRELPRTITGKVDRKALPASDNMAHEGRPGHVPPRTVTEEVLAGLWSQLLMVERIGVADGFFELGGHSIVAMQLLARINDVFGVEIPLATLFDAPTLAVLAAAVDEALGAATTADPVTVVSRDRRWPQSFSQQRLWFLEQLMPGTAAYHMPAAVRIQGPLNPDRLEAALNLVLRRQEGLCTGFREAFQVIVPDAALELRRFDLSDCSSAAAETELNRRVAAEMARPFDLGRPPLMSALLIRRAADDHVLVLVMHHLVSDAWSVGVLCRDIAAAYGALNAGPAAALPALAFQYLDFAVWQLRAQTTVLEERLSFWRQRLADLPPLELPTDRPRPVMPSFRGQRRPFALDAETVAGLRQLARRYRVTLFMVLLASFKSLLHRYTGQADIAIGVAVANRPLTAMEDVIGFFANTLVLRTSLDGDPTFAELLARVRRTTLDAYAHQDVSFDQVVRLLQPERDLSRQPLFQVMFVLQNAPMPPIRLPELTFSELDIDPGAARFDLTFELHEADGGIAGHVDFALDLFDAATVDRLLDHFRRLMRACAADPLCRLSALPILSEPERQALLAPATAMDDPRAGACLHELFAIQVKAMPHAVAVTFRDQRITYAELDRRANRLANHLRAKGVGPETCVALCLERSADMVVAILGVLKAGGAYLPLDPAQPTERLGFMLQDAGSAFVVTRSDMLGRLPPIVLQAVCLDGDEEAIAARSPSCPDSSAGPGNTAYVIYTSGSTGRPKGVSVEHRHVVRLFLATERHFAPGPSDVWTLFHSYAFDFSVWEIWGALLYGGRLVVVPYWQVRSPDALLDLILEEGVTVLNQTPSAFWHLAHARELANAPCPPTLRLVIFGGEALDFRRLRRWFDRCGDERPRLVNMYGITETTVHVTCRPITRADAEGASPSVIGPPLDDLALYVLDRHQQPVPYGVTGELYVGGAGLSRGYLNRAALTAERFVPDAFGGRPGARLYRSGDIARRRADGEIEYLGRIDQQVKVRGFRVELTEIEAVLAEYSAVREVAVLLREDVPGEPRLVAYVTRQSGRAVLVEDLRRFAAARLPDYMIPAAVVVLDALPMTGNGKTDRKALPAPATERPYLTTEFVAPRTERELLLADIWSAVLAVEKIGIRDNFFVLGGDSIRSIQVCARAQARGLPITVQQLFRLQTIEALMREIAGGGPPSATVPDRGAFALIASVDDLARMPEDVEDAFPLATLQLGMLYHSDLGDGGSAYHDVFTYRLRAEFDLKALSRVLEAISARHPILRTSFDLSTYSEPLQLVHRRAPMPLAVEDLRTLPPDAQDMAVAAWIRAEKCRSRDWRRPPLLDLHIHRLSGGCIQFSMSFHHAILDGWSVASFLTELFREYFSRLEGHPPPLLPAPSLSYRQFVALERQTMAQRASRDFWNRHLAGSSFTRMPRRSAASGLAFGIEERDVTIAPAVSEGLKSAARAAGVPIKSVLLAAHARVLGLLANATDVVTGMVVPTRLEEADGERVLGLFLNTLPARMRIDHGSWSELVRRAFEAETALLAHRRYPLALIQREQGGAPLFEAVFNFTHYHVYRDLGRLTDAEVVDGHIYEETNFPLTANFSLDVPTDQVRLLLQCDRTVFADPRQIDALCGYYVAALADLAHAPESPAEEASLMAPKEVQARLDAGAGPSAPPSSTPVHALIAAQAARTPAAPAVEDDDEVLTYAELQARVMLLARRLRGAGVGSEVLVAMYLPRTVDLVVGLLAVLEAGGAYLPLDGDYPRQRLAHMMADAGQPLLLTHRHLPGLDLPGPVLNIDGPDDDQVPGASAHSVRLHQVGPKTAAYVIYTSGSTGTPKGVVVSHGALSNFLAAMRTRLTLAPGDRLLAVTGLPFDIAALELLLPLTLGATVVIARGETVQDPLRLAARLKEARISVLQATPSVWTALVESGWRAGAHLTVLCGGEALDRALADRLSDSGARVWNLYGPTETTVWSSAHAVEAGSTTVPLGRPLRNTQLYVLDHRMRPVPIGVPGELWIGGAGVARGYLDRPRLTAERFVPDPFGTEPGARLYRTGDLVRWLPGDTMEFLGRVDQQVKIRGHRVELGEIETVLAAHPGVGRCVAALSPTKRGADPRLVAYFTAPYETPPAASALRRWLFERIPHHMVPAEFVRLDVLPMTPNGKIDRAALPQFETISAPRAQPAPPRDWLELAVAQLWEEVLGIQPVGVLDHFTHDLGGHSLQAIRLVAHLREKFDPAFGLTTFLQAGTVAQVAADLRSRCTPTATPLVPLQPSGQRTPLFCVHPAVGNVLCYLGLSRRLGRQQPFFGLQVPEAQENDAALDDVEAMAAAYVAAMRSVQPHGPYMLAGHSFGGLVAFEMARQLRQAGERVALLALMDAILPDCAFGAPVDAPSMAAAAPDDAQWLADTARTLERYFQRSLGITAQDLRALSPDGQMARVLDALVRADLVPASAGLSLLSSILAAQKASERAASRYRPGRFDGPVTLLRAGDLHPDDARRIPAALLADPALGWGAFADGGIQVHMVAGDHLSMLTEPLVEGLADALRSCLDAAEGIGAADSRRAGKRG
jgi:amino acid adenylation domain-containing protein